MKNLRRIGILTGGGDVPGLNVAIKAVTLRARDHDIEVLGLRRGWASMLIDPVTRRRSPRRRWPGLPTQGAPSIARAARSSHSSRTNPSNV